MDEGYFGDLFDIDGDGKLDTLERALDIEAALGDDDDKSSDDGDDDDDDGDDGGDDNCDEYDYDEDDEDEEDEEDEDEDDEDEDDEDDEDDENEDDFLDEDDDPLTDEDVAAIIELLKYIKIDFTKLDELVELLRAIAATDDGDEPDPD